MARTATVLNVGIIGRALQDLKGHLHCSAEEKKPKILKEQFCLWLVPSGSGDVKKVRFSGRRAIACSLAVILILGGLFFVAGDYARVQLVRLQETLSFAALQERHTVLTTEAEELSSRVEQLKRERDALEVAQGAVRARVLELHTLLSEMNSLGLSVRGLDGLSTLTGGPLEGQQGIGEGDHHEHSHHDHSHEDIKESDQAKEEGIGGLETELTVGEPDSEKDPTLKLSGQSLISHLDQVIADLRHVPLGYPGNGYVNSKFGPRRSPFSGRYRMHQGIDLALPYGSFIQTTADGVVDSVKRTRSYGLVIDVKHKSGAVTRYAHLSKALVREGEKVCRGEYLGLVGNSGMSTGPHLHYEIRVDKKAINPLPLMRIPSKVEFSSLL